MSKDVLCIYTNNFPFFPGEEFIDDEVEYYSYKNRLQIVVCPLRGKKIRKTLPSNVIVSNVYRKSLRLSLIGRSIYILFFLLNKLFWKELFLNKAPRKNLNALFQLLNLGSLSLAIAETSKHHLRFLSKNRKLLLYSYWFDIIVYGLVVMRKKTGADIPIITRAHGYDVYRERRPAAYMPIKRQLGKLADCIYAVSKSTKDYLSREYSLGNEQIKVSYLGSKAHSFISPENTGNSIRIVSCSSCYPVKRLDRMLRVIHGCAQLDQNRDIFWTHIGDGPTRKEILKEACKIQESIRNMSVNFIGYISHDLIFQYYKTNPIDIFINTSDSEAIPVSIMEAMSFGIPLVAPSIGGIPELLNKDSGILLKKGADPSEYAQAIYEIKNNNSQFNRDDIKSIWKKTFCAEQNFQKMFEQINTFYRT